VWGVELNFSVQLRTPGPQSRFTPAERGAATLS
jgi:hypothetical protein